MRLITKEIDVCIVSNNYKHYEDLGYCIPKEINKNGKEIIKTGTCIKVKVCDLPKNSHYNVDIECDHCGDKLTVSYGQYINNVNKHNGKYICSSKKLLVKDKYVNTTDVTYDDLVILYNQYIEKYGEVPTYTTCDLKHNMPQGRIITRVLKENNITYNDFLLQFGKVSHVRTESKDYDLYVKRFKDVCEKIGHTLRGSELYNNQYGLPNQGWFIKNCPDKNVKCYDDFIKWCGYDSNKLEKDRDTVINTLINLEKELGRPITRNDISLEKTGFSMIVLKRMFGGLTQAKKELGLMKTLPNQPLSFEYYRNELDKILDNIKSHTDRKYISWGDIESEINNPKHLEHKTLTKSFKREGIDIFAYIKSKGFMMNPSNFSFHYTFDDGECVVSSMEYEFSSYLRSLGFEYKKGYYRNILYKTFSDEQSKMNCDYKIMIDGIPLYVEIAGIIYNCKDDSWRDHKFASKKENEYRDKMIKKEKRLIESGQHFLFLFKTEMFNDEYKTILQNEINRIRQEAA